MKRQSSGKPRRKVPVVLILTSTAHRREDPAIDRVALAIARRGGRARFVHTDQFPHALRLTERFDARESFALDAEGGPIRWGDLAAVWLRHTAVAEALPRNMTRPHRAASALIAEIAFHGALQCIPDEVFVLDRYDTLLALPSKPRQIQLARSLGIDTPRTLVTNDPAAVRPFARTCKTGVVVKMLESSSVTVGARGKEEPIYTRTLRPDEDLSGLEVSPMIFQERLPKARELRVTVVGRRVFTASVDPKGSALGADDWRRDKALVGGFEACALPRGMQPRLLKLLDKLGLNFGTIDLIATPEGRCVFLEVNAISFFGFVERSTGLAISDAVADLLLGREPPRVGRLKFQGARG